MIGKFYKIDTPVHNGIDLELRACVQLTAGTIYPICKECYSLPQTIGYKTTDDTPNTRVYVNILDTNTKHVIRVEYNPSNICDRNGKPTYSQDVNAQNNSILHRFFNWIKKTL